MGPDEPLLRRIRWPNVAAALGAITAVALVALWPRLTASEPLLPPGTGRPQPVLAAPPEPPPEPLADDAEAEPATAPKRRPRARKTQRRQGEVRRPTRRRHRAPPRPRVVAPAPPAVAPAPVPPAAPAPAPPPRPDPPHRPAATDPATAEFTPG